MLDARHPRSVLTAESGDGPCGTLVAPVHADVAVPAYPDDTTVHIGDLPTPNASRSRRTTALLGRDTPVLQLGHLKIGLRGDPSVVIAA